MTNIELRSDMHVELIDHMGSDLSIARAAWVSTKGERAEDETDLERVKGLINFLMKGRHGTPFEHNSMTFLVKAPIFVWREHHRHRIGVSYNEESGRYKKLDPVFYVPEHSRVQTGKPGHYVYEKGDEELDTEMHYEFQTAAGMSYGAYEYLLELGMAREVARMILPVNIFSSCYVTFNARSLMNFLSLRTKDETATFPSFPQEEIEMIGRKYEAIFANLFPLTHAAFVENGRVSP